MGLTYSISERISQGQNALISDLKDRGPLNNTIGRKVSRLAIRHFQTYSAAHPNKLGGKRTNYVAKMGDATSYRSDAEGTTVVIAHEGTRLRVEGGTIKPTGGRKYLTIPAIASAYGKRAREYPNLSLMYRRKGGKVEAFALGVNPYTPVGKGAPKRKGSVKRIGKDSRQVVFWLVKSANIPANRGLLPSDTEIQGAIKEATDAFLRTKGGGNVADS